MEVLLGLALLYAAFAAGRHVTRNMSADGPAGKLASGRAGGAFRDARKTAASHPLVTRARAVPWRRHLATGARRTGTWYRRRVTERANRPPQPGVVRRLLVPAGAPATMPGGKPGAAPDDLAPRREARRVPADGPLPSAGTSPPVLARAPMPVIADPVPANGRTPMTTPTATGSAADLFTAVQQIIGHAKSGGFQAKHRAVKALAEAHDYLSQAMDEFAGHMAEPGQQYPPQVWEPLSAVSAHDKGAAMAAAESDAAMTALGNMSVRELAGSPVRAPHHDELNSDA